MKKLILSFFFLTTPISAFSASEGVITGEVLHLLSSNTRTVITYRNHAHFDKLLEITDQIAKHVVEDPSAFENNMINVISLVKNHLGSVEFSSKAELAELAQKIDYLSNEINNARIDYNRCGEDTYGDLAVGFNEVYQSVKGVPRCLRLESTFLEQLTEISDRLGALSQSIPDDIDRVELNQRFRQKIN